jgi:hypothetical protein
MPLAHGQAILAPEVEQVCELFSAAQFASLCNSLAWAISAPDAATVPSYTERVNVADGGIDAEWTTPAGAGWAATSTLIRPGWNVFQYKQRRIVAQGRDTTFDALKNSMRGALVDVRNRTGRMPDSYVLFTPIDLTHVTAPQNRRRDRQAPRVAAAGDEPGAGQKQQLIDAISHGLDPAEQVDVRIVGAAELAAFLNDKPYVRSAYFATNSFTSWSAANTGEEERSGRVYGPRVALQGRQAERDELAEAIGNPNVRAIILAGPHGIGKSRLALEATADRQYLTVFALDPELSVPDIRALSSPGNEVIVVVEDPSPDTARRLMQEITARQDIKLVLAVPTPRNVPPIGFGETEAARILQIAPLADQEAEAILNAAGARFPWSVSSWVVRQAGGIPGIMLAAARMGDRLQQGHATFAEQVAIDFEERLRAIPQYGEQMYRVLRPLSLLTQVGVEGPAAEEARVMYALFGDGITLNEVNGVLPRLRQAGFVRERGRYLEVVPPLLANYLAVSALHDRFGELLALFTQLGPGGKRRLLERLRGVRSPEVGRFWDELTGPHGLVRDLPSGLEHATVAEALTIALPERMQEILTRDLGAMTLDQLRGLVDGSRRQLVSILTGLLFQARTSGAALRALAKVAESELGSTDDNARRLFSETTHPLHPQFPLSLADRVALLAEMAAADATVEHRRLAAEAISKVLARHVSMPLRPSEGAEPLATQPDMTWANVWDYQAVLLGILITLAHSDDASVARAAGGSLPAALEECAVVARPEAAVEAYRRVVNSLLTGALWVSVSRLVSSLKQSKSDFDTPNGEIPEELQARLTTASNELEQLIAQVEAASFQVRLRRWAGEYSAGEDEEVGQNGAQPRSQIKLQELAKEAVQQPELLDNDTVSWLTQGMMSEAQKAHVFWRALGRADTHGRHLLALERIAESPGGVDAFGWYYCGYAETNPEAAEDRLEQLMDNGTVGGPALAYASRLAETGGQAPTRLMRLLRDGRVEPDMIERILRWGRWVDNLSPDEYLAICEAMLERGNEHTLSVISLISWWLFLGREIDERLTEIAWRCLETAPNSSRVAAYDCDKVAGWLCERSPDRGFALLELLLAQPFQRHCWNPLDVQCGQHFWPTLLQMDKRRALDIVMHRIQAEDVTYAFTIREELRQHLDQVEHAEALQELVDINEDTALGVCGFITLDKPGYWPIAFRVIEQYGDSVDVRRALTSSLWERMTVMGGFGHRYEWALEQVERTLQDAATPAAARPWLEEARGQFRQRAEDEHRDDIEDYILNHGLQGAAHDQEQRWGVDAAARTGHAGMLQRVMPPDEADRE